MKIKVVPFREITPKGINTNNYLYVLKYNENIYLLQYISALPKDRWIFSTINRPPSKSYHLYYGTTAEEAVTRAVENGNEVWQFDTLKELVMEMCRDS